jgi:hypothetical protein
MQTKKRMARNSLSMTLQTFVNELERMLHKTYKQRFTKTDAQGIFPCECGFFTSVWGYVFCRLKSIGLASMCLFGSTHNKNYHGPLSKAVYVVTGIHSQKHT